MIVDLGVFELGEIECGGVSHETHTETVREQIAEQTLEQRGEPRQPFAYDGDAQLQADQYREMPPIGQAARTDGRHARDDGVDDELADPQNRDRDE